MAGIQTHGELLHWHPHIHTLVTCGAFTPEGDFLELPQFDLDSLLLKWQEAVFALYLAEGKIQEQVEKILKHCGLWQEPASRAPPCLRACLSEDARSQATHRQADIDGLAGELAFSFSKRESGFSSIQPGQELVYEDIDTFLATF